MRDSILEAIDWSRASQDVFLEDAETEDGDPGEYAYELMRAWLRVVGKMTERHNVEFIEGLPERAWKLVSLVLPTREVWNTGGYWAACQGIYIEDIEDYPTDMVEMHKDGKEKRLCEWCGQKFIASHTSNRVTCSTPCSKERNRSLR